MSYTYTETTGTIVADTSDIKSDVQDEIEADFESSSEVVEDSSTIEGRIVEMQTSIRSEVMSNNAEVANQFNPAYATGLFFDAIYALIGGSRTAATRSQVTETLSGVSGTTIPAGSYIKNSSTQTLWYTAEDVTLDDDGAGSVTVYSNDTGEIAAEAGTLTKIVSSVTGWETATNASSATLGEEEQTVAEGKIARIQALYRNAGNCSGAVKSAILELDDVDGCQVYLNNSESTYQLDSDDSDSIIPAHTGWICVDGGAADDIVESYVTHTAGLDLFSFQDDTDDGTFTDSISGQEYTMTVDRPVEKAISIDITATLSSSTDLVTQIKEALQEWAAGNISGYDGCTMGEDISPFTIASALNDYFGSSTISITDINIGWTSASSTSTSTISVAMWQKPTLSNSNIDVTEG